MVVELDPEGGDREGEQSQSPVGEHVVEPESLEDLTLVEEADLTKEIGAARTRKRKERIEPAREGQSKRSRWEERFGGSSSLAGITQALERTGEAHSYLSQMAYDIRHRARDMHALEDVDPLAGLVLTKEKLTRVRIYTLLFSGVVSLGLRAALSLQVTLLMYAVSKWMVMHLQGDAEAKCQQVREAEENNRALLQRLEQVEQDTVVFRDQAETTRKEVAELKEAMRGKDEQVRARELAVAKVASLESEVARLTQFLTELKVSWKAKCGRAAGVRERLFCESEVYKQQLRGVYNKGQDDLSRAGCQMGWINKSAMRKWYAEREQAEILRSLVKQHDA